MDIKPETSKRKVAYPTLAAVGAAVTLISCQQQQPLSGAPLPPPDHQKAETPKKPEPKQTKPAKTGSEKLQPQRLGGKVRLHPSSND